MNIFQPDGVNTLSDLLQQYRKNNGLTQDFVAAQLNVSRSAYSYYETGKTEPSLRSLGILAKIYGISISDFLPQEGVSDSDGRLSRKMQQGRPSSLGYLTPEEGQFLAIYRLAGAKEKRKAAAVLSKTK